MKQLLATMPARDWIESIDLDQYSVDDLIGLAQALIQDEEICRRAALYSDAVLNHDYTDAPF